MLTEEPKPKDQSDRSSKLAYELTHCQYLPRPKDIADPGFFSVLKQRRTRRSFGPLDLEQLSTLCWYTGKAWTNSPASTGWQHRIPPSAGGCHPVDLWAVERSRIRWYDPIGHSLCDVATTDQSVAAALFDAANAVVPIDGGTLLWLVAVPERTAQLYDHPESLVWRDAGIVLATLVYTATALDLSICPIGILGTAAVRRAISGHDLVGAGGCVVGSTPTVTEAA